MPIIQNLCRTYNSKAVMPPFTLYNILPLKGRNCKMCISLMGKAPDGDTSLTVFLACHFRLGGKML